MASIAFSSVATGVGTVTGTLERAGLSGVAFYGGDPSAPAGGSVSSPGPVVPSTYTTEPSVALVEGGSDPLVLADGVTNLNSDATHSAGLLGFAFAPITGTTGTVYSTERWVRLRFEAPFNSVQGARFWVPNASSIAAGWTIKWGTSASYQTPVSTASTIATGSLPTTDPGINAPNLIAAPITGDQGDGFTLWLVLQATVDLSTAGPQVIGYDPESITPEPLKLQIAWVDT